MIQPSRLYTDPSWQYQLLRYLCIGGISAGCDIAVFVLLLAGRLPILVVATLSYGCGLAVHFTLNKYVNFRAHNRPIHHQASIYAMVAFICWLTTLVVIKSAVVMGIPPLIGKLAAIVIGAPIGFFGHRRFTFGRGQAGVIRRASLPIRNSDDIL
jgi:putative flippase GtrA